ncbi:hypothetical protein [Salinimicrobium sp. TH3]|uniref:hypothetical protein n=1 Tax=Salinimicrobium sp. TH3 TaxID=2997342 RepID=UPI002275F24C|nr:hypothetical protein [Salinimicrobium sp. TH3]MCY2688484.1 hypothetical protein [Salinimicrobium sp. TH3]
MNKDKLERMPLYQKAMEILEIVVRIKQLVPEDNEFTIAVAQNMYTDALQLAPKIAGAEGVELYDIKMENAAIIRKCAREIFVGCNGFIMEGFKELEYLEMLRAEVEEFRVLFAEWVQTFDQWNYIIDRWGLFNPPGVKYDDVDPDDNIPFDNPFDEED